MLLLRIAASALVSFVSPQQPTAHSLQLQPTKCTVPLILPSPRNTHLLWAHQAATTRWAVPRQTAPSLTGPLAGAASLPTRTARFVQGDRLRRWLPQLPAADQTVLLEEGDSPHMASCWPPSINIHLLDSFLSFFPSNMSACPDFSLVGQY